MANFSLVRDEVESRLKLSPSEVLGRLFKANILTIPRGNGTLSIVGMPCPLCQAQGTKESTPIYLSSNRKTFCCESCGERESVVYLSFPYLGVSESDLENCAIALSDFFSIDESTLGKKTGNGFVVDAGDPSSPPIESMPIGKKDWVNASLAAFVKRADSNNLDPRERAALAYVMKRGISESTIRKSKLFTNVNHNKIMVIMPSYDCKNELIGYQWFDYSDVAKGEPPSYHACKKEFGSCKYPFGVETCIEKSGPIFMVCGFFDYLSAIESGFDKVLSPFGVTMLSGDAKHIEPIINGQTVNILFDKKTQEIENAMSTAKSLKACGANPNIITWGKAAKVGYDFNDFLVACKKNKIENVKEFFISAIKDKKINLIQNPDHTMLYDIFAMSGLIETQPVAEPPIQIDISLPGREKGEAKFEIDLEKAVTSIKPLDEFHTLILFTNASEMFEMCNVLEPKRCGLAESCTCVLDKKIDISSGYYASAFFNNKKMNAAITSVVKTYNFMCPKQISESGKPKEIFYTASHESKTWRVIEARSLFSSNAIFKMIYDGEILRSGLYEAKGFKSAHCGENAPVIVITEMKKYSIDNILNQKQIESCTVPECDFFDSISAMIDEKIVESRDMPLVSIISVWACSPLVVPLIKDIGKEIETLQPAFSIYAIGDPATGKTNTVKEISAIHGDRCDPTDAKMTTRAGLIMSGADGSPGQMPKSIGRFICLDEVSDRQDVLHNSQLLVENRLQLSMSGRNIDEIIPVRVALLSNANAERKKLKEFRTPLAALVLQIREHMVRRMDACISTRLFTDDFDVEARNHKLYCFNHKKSLTREQLKNLGLRSHRQLTSKITVNPDALEFLKNESVVLSAFKHSKICNPMMYGDICQKVFRIACGIACRSSSFDEDKLIVKMQHVNYAIILLDECMYTMECTKEASYSMRSINEEKSSKALLSVLQKSIEMAEAIDVEMCAVGRVILNFVQSCYASDTDSDIVIGLGELHRKKGLQINPYKKAWNIINLMKRNGLIKSCEKSRGTYVVTEMFFRAMSIIEVDHPVIFEKTIKD